MVSKVLTSVAGGIIAAALASVASIAVVTGANAATCLSYVANSVTGYINDPDVGGGVTCAIGTSSTNDSESEMDLIGSGGYLGGLTGWTVIGSVGNPGAGLSVPALTGADTFTDGAGSLDGTWSIANSLYSTWSVVAFVFSDGLGTNILPNTFVVYMTNLANSSGMFRSPFVNTNGDTPTDISHWSLYGIETCLPTNLACGGEAVIPLPAAFPLFATALGGLGLLGWRRRRKAAA